MKIVDFFPTKGTFKPGEIANFQICINNPSRVAINARFSFYHLTEQITQINHSFFSKEEEEIFLVDWKVPMDVPRGYAVQVQIIDDNGRVLDKASTAFDVLTDWTEFPRYGFMTDFRLNRDDIEEAVKILTRFHINGLQFYDWQYRHDQLVAPTTDYIDPLGRQLSLATVKKCIKTAHEYGMKAMPYLAVYAASLEFWREHQDWALYDANQNPMTFSDFLGLMDPTMGKPWILKLRKECSQLLEELPFDGFHIDQYGDPKEGFNSQGDPANIPDAFVGFIRTLKEDHPKASITFNAVGNWPIEALAHSAQDFVYIEVWKPKTNYLDLPDMILNARVLSGNKPVVMAVYIPAERITNIRLTDALIFSSGGSRIELGEKKGYLTDPYFPKFQSLSPELARALRNIYDFAVRYQELIGPSAGHELSCSVDLPQDVWATVRSKGKWMTVSMVNLSGIETPRWDQPHQTPTRLTDFRVRVQSPGKILRVWYGSPDWGNLDLQPISWNEDNGFVVVSVPSLDYWSLITFELQQEEGNKR